MKIEIYEWSTGDWCAIVVEGRLLWEGHPPDIFDFASLLDKSPNVEVTETYIEYNYATDSPSRLRDYLAARAINQPE